MKKTMPFTPVLRELFVLVLLVGAILIGDAAWAETLVQRNVDSRVTLAFRVSQVALGSWLPTRWEINAAAKGPSAEANLFVTFIDQYISQDSDGKLIAGGNNRIVGLTVPVKNSDTGETAVIVIRLYTSNPEYVPGPYRNSAPAQISREASLSGANLEPGNGTELWNMRDNNEDEIAFRVKFQRGIPTRIKSEVKPHSSVDPAFYRVYRYEEGADIVRSIPTQEDRVQDYYFSSTVQELAKLFDGSEQLVSITIRPWYIREVFLP
jgi:hypothetical protein